MEDLEIEDSELVATEHDRLVSAISKLDRTQHITDPTRSEPTNLSSEFNLIKTDKKLKLSNVVKVLENTAHHVKIGKNLKKTQGVTNVLRKPLEKPQAERVKRATGYEQTKEKVGRWDPVVARNRTVDFVSFPLRQESDKLQPTESFLSKLKLKSVLEKELDEIDPPPAIEEDEEEQLYPMSYQEMLEHRQNLAKLRAQQSYKAAKAKRQGKIKSKKYHRILKKQKLKQQLKEFEELQKTDPEEALKKLEALERARALERHTLRHKNTGKWAKSKLVRAKYDKDVRQQLAEQLSVSRGLTQKVKDESSDDGDDSELIPDIALSQDPRNPWMMQRTGKSNVDSEFDFGYKKYLKEKVPKQKLDTGSDSDEDSTNNHNNSELDILKKSIDKMYFEEDKSNSVPIIEEVVDINKNKNYISNEKKKKRFEIKSNDSQSDILISKLKNIKKVKVASTTNWIVETSTTVETSKDKTSISSAFEMYEDAISNKVENRLKNIRKQIESLEKPTKLKTNTGKKRARQQFDNLESLKFKTQKKNPVIDEELIETSTRSNKEVDKVSSVSELVKVATATEKDPENINSNIDPSRFIEAKPKYLNSALPEGDNNLDQLDDDDEQVVPKVNIEEVFEEDDVVASFRQEKEDEINKNKIQDVTLSLPGWGSWGGKGVKAPKRKKNRFILKAPPMTPRRDENKGDIIIKEYKNEKLTAHKVTEVPFPFTSVKEYEASIRGPLGNTFIPEKAHKKLIRPNVITRIGAIIEPMDEDELLVKRNRVPMNTSIIKILGQK